MNSINYPISSTVLSTGHRKMFNKMSAYSYLGLETNCILHCDTVFYNKTFYPPNFPGTQTLITWGKNIVFFITVLNIIKNMWGYDDVTNNNNTLSSASGSKHKPTNLCQPACAAHTVLVTLPRDARSSILICSGMPFCACACMHWNIYYIIINYFLAVCTTWNWNTTSIFELIMT